VLEGVALFEKWLSPKKHEILLINDNPYSFVLNDRPMSLLQVGARGSFRTQLLE
jgi:hypothetical protein